MSVFQDPVCNARMETLLHINSTTTRLPTTTNATTNSADGASVVYMGGGVAVTKGMDPSSVNFTSGCGSMGLLHNATIWHPTEVASANVFKFNAIDDLSGGAAHTFVTLSSCDGTNVYNVSKPGVFVVKGQGAVLIFERLSANGSRSGNASVCPAGSKVMFEFTSLERYCAIDKSLAECKNVTPVAVSPASRTYSRRSTALAFVAACLTMVASVAF